MRRSAPRHGVLTTVVVAVRHCALQPLADHGLCLVTMAALAGLTGCGSGGGAGDGSSSAPAGPAKPTALVTTWYDEDRLYPQEAGAVLLDTAGQPTGAKSGVWTTWYPPEQGNSKQFEKTYRDGTWDAGSYWREWNSDTTLRFDWRDQ